MKKIILTGSSIDSGNRGCSALAYSALYILNQINKKHQEKVEIYFYDANSSEQIRSVVLNDEKITFYQFEGFSVFSFIIGCIRSKFRSLKVFISVDYFFNFCGGDSYSDIYGKERFYKINNWNRLAFLFRKKVIFFPQTIGPFLDDDLRKAAHITLKKLRAVFARDHKSFLYLQNNIKDPNQFEAIDLAFFLPYQQENFEKKGIHVGLNISALLWNGGYTQNNQFNLSVDYQSLIHTIINYFLNQSNVRLHIISHDLSLNKGLGNDYEIACKIYREYQTTNLILAPFFLDAVEAKNYIAGMNFFLGARMHATIAAFSSGVPVYPMAYSRKFMGLFSDTLEYQYCGDMTILTNDKMIIEIQEAFENRDFLKIIISKKMHGFVNDRYNILFSELDKIIGLK